MKFTYLLINLFTIIVPLIFSFHPKLNFYKTWPAFFPAVIITAIIFITWDTYFTAQKVWGFNPAYLTGCHICNLPLEEILFFFCIPYACVFTYHSLSIFIKKQFPKKGFRWFTIIFIIVCVLLALIYRNRQYTLYTFTFLALLLFVSRFIVKVNWFPQFYITYSLLLIPFLIVNGMLTGTGLQNPVVWYNNQQTIGIRILTIPVEDVFYGMDLILLNVLLYAAFQNKFYNATLKTVL